MRITPQEARDEEQRVLVTRLSPSIAQRQHIADVLDRLGATPVPSSSSPPSEDPYLCYGDCYGDKPLGPDPEEG